jgi:hypothetical protein
MVHLSSAVSVTEMHCGAAGGGGTGVDNHAHDIPGKPAHV